MRQNLKILQKLKNLRLKFEIFFEICVLQRKHEHSENSSLNQ
jgi:hypothetical protein